MRYSNGEPTTDTPPQSKGVVGCGTIAEESNTERNIKGLTAVPYIRVVVLRYYIYGVHTLAIYMYPRTPTEKAIKTKKKKETEK